MSTYHHGDLPGVLLSAAAEILDEQGLEGLSLREAARRAGVSHSAPYRHFPDRESLLAELAAQGFRDLGEALSGKRGREMGEAYIRFALAHPNRFRLMFGGRLELKRHASLEAASSATYEALVAAFRTQPEIANAEKAAAAAWSLVHGLAQLLLDGHFARQAADAGAFVHDVIGAVRFASRPA